MPIDRDSLEALKNIIEQIELLISTRSNCRRTGRFVAANYCAQRKRSPMIYWRVVHFHEKAAGPAG